MLGKKVIRAVLIIMILVIAANFVYYQFINNENCNVNLAIPVVFEITNILLLVITFIKKVKLKQGFIIIVLIYLLFTVFFTCYTKVDKITKEGVDTSFKDEKILVTDINAYGMKVKTTSE